MPALQRLHPTAPLPEDLGSKQFHPLATEIIGFCKHIKEENPIHHDKKEAKKAGFKNIIAPGVMTMGFVSGFIAERLPGSIARNVRATFRNPVYPGDALTVLLTARKQEVKKEILFATLAFTVVNYRGEKVANGEVDILLGAPSEEKEKVAA